MRKTNDDNFHNLSTKDQHLRDRGRPGGRPCYSPVPEFLRRPFVAAGAERGRASAETQGHCPAPGDVFFQPHLQCRTVVPGIAPEKSLFPRLANVTHRDRPVSWTLRTSHGHLERAVSRAIFRHLHCSAASDSRGARSLGAPSDVPGLHLHADRSRTCELFTGLPGSGPHSYLPAALSGAFGRNAVVRAQRGVSGIYEAYRFHFSETASPRPVIELEE